MNGIPEFDKNGLLPEGIHDCSLAEIQGRFTWNDHRQQLYDKLLTCIAEEIRPLFSQPILINGSFVTDKPYPGDIDIVLDLKNASKETALRGRQFIAKNQERLMKQYDVHFWVDFPGIGSNFSQFFQYLGDKNAQHKGLDPHDLKGMLRVKK